MGWREKIRNAFRRGHKDLYDGVKEYAEKRGVATTDVVASAVASYLASDDEGRETLEKAMEEGRKRGYGGGAGDVTAAVDIFTKMADSMSKMFTSVNELRSSVSIGSIVSDFETVTTAVQKIKGMGTEAGKGSMEDTLADAFIRGIINKMTGGMELGLKKTKKTGESKVEEVDQ